ncbi:hypothetical protein HVIM_04267 [Roseomonas mucosa]|nr:hypothetical protein HVIM_04267 [Roseomonas mucosa]
MVLFLRAACGKCPVLKGFRRISTDRARRKKRVRLVKAAEPLIPGGYRASLFARNRRRSRPRITPRQRCHPGRAGADQRDLACPRRRTSIVSPRAITIVSIPLRNSPCSTTSGIAAIAATISVGMVISSRAASIRTGWTFANGL